MIALVVSLAHLSAPALGAPPVEAVVLMTQGTAVCAGAFVDAEGTVATAYHCVAAGGRPWIDTLDGRRAKGRVIGIDRAADLALVSAPDLAGSPFLEIRAETPELGDEAWALGHPYGARPPTGFMTGTLRWSASLGAVSQIGDRALQITAPVNPGNSGGPVVDGEGRLVGVVSRRLGGDGLGFAGRSDRLAALVADPQGHMSPFGGTLGGNVYIPAWQPPGEAVGLVSVGVRAEASLRDTFFADAGFAVPVSGRFDALRFGEVSWLASQGRVGARARFLHGIATLRVDAFGGLVEVRSRTGGVADGAIDLPLPSSVPAPIAGFGLAAPGLGFGFDVAWVQLYGTWTPQMTFVTTWPGTVMVF